MRCFAAVVIAIVATTSVAHAGVEIGGIGGLHQFSESDGLGATPVPSQTSLKNSALFGVRFGVYFGGKIGVELEGGAIPSEPRSVLFDVWAAAYRAQVVYQLRADKPTATLLPFVLVGGGGLTVVSSVNEDIVKKDTIITPYAGFGAKYRTGGNWGVRVDVRALFAQKADEMGKKSGFVPEVELLLGIFREIGRKQIKKEAPPPPKGDDDPDKDGIVGAADKCPNEAEDKDGFQDTDGCPDPDNDGDGILDAADKCPLEPEDKDGFQDEDGCPDPDNDGDGVLDAADKCPDKPETKNGFQDEDGCPDEIPETLKAFTGVIQGINFKVSDAALAPGSSKTLDKAIAVLAEFKDVKVEIQGHTDDQPIAKGGKYADNTALSQARAETVKAYFVAKGIEEARLIAKGYGDSAPIDDPKSLKGVPLNNARAKNRRVEFKLITAEVAAPPAPKDEPKKDEPKKDEPKKDEPKKDEPKPKK